MAKREMIINMKMNKKIDFFIIFATLIFFSCYFTKNTDEDDLPEMPKREFPFEISDENYWRNIATATRIFIANTSDLIIENAIPNEYYEYNIQIIKTLRGIKQEKIRFKIYMKEENCNYINSLNDSKKVILFLTNSYDGYGYNNYFSGYFIEKAVIKYTSEIENIINKEIALQNDIINNKLYENFDIDSKLYQKVSRYITNTTNSSLEHKSFEQLEELGAKGVPYIILLLDNFEKLPIGEISLENKSENAFEYYRHYSPELVIDALDAILNQITGENFGTIVNGEATQEMRISVLNGWRIYLYKLIHNNQINKLTKKQNNMPKKEPINVRTGRSGSFAFV